MQITIPIHIEKRKGGAAWSRHVHCVRPLFFDEPCVSNESLSQAVTELSQKLSKQLEALGRESEQSELAAWTFSPPVEEATLSLELELKRHVGRGKFFFVMFRGLGRRIAFCANLPQLWFEVSSGQSLALRAREVLTRHFREQEKLVGDDYQIPQDVMLQGTAWIARLDLSVAIHQQLKPPELTLAALFGGNERLNGGLELQQVGRCLNWQFPHELERALHREREVAELTRILTAPDRRPVLLIGPAMSGKTTVVHEFVFRVTARRKSPYKNRRNVWWLSPQRLVSGMMFVGQWEQRLLAIVKHAVKRDHVLYFDDFLGLYQAGVSSDSNLNMAQVLRPYLERRECRVLAEMTPAAFRVFRELDRGLADTFHVIPVPEPAPDRNLSILIDVIRQLELRHGCRFDADVLPVTLDLQRRYGRENAFPGKAARFLQRLAVRAGNEPVCRPGVLQEFQAQSGLTQPFVDPRIKLQRSDVVTRLQREIRGQPEAIAAVADVLCIAKARLNDTQRPLGALLFLGPTGVGKTQCAKSLANFLFGDPERVVRFDMNEFVEPGAAATLVGTFANPEGLLTSAIRRQPFAVVLFDEIEKAYPDVFDLLLQVLGEGRLSDSRGRTVDFSNTIIVLTSNLGVKASASRVGFSAGSTVERYEYIKAAEGFFRPEFFNRLDRIVPFENLSPADIRGIASRILQELLARDGLSRRKCILNIDSAVLDQVAQRAFSPQYGARALKRGIERQLTEPVAQRLAALPFEQLTVLNLLPGPHGAVVDLQALPELPADPAALAQLQILDAGQGLERLGRLAVRLDQQVSKLRNATPVEARTLSSADFTYFSLREQLTVAGERLREFEEDFARRRGTDRRYTGPVAAGPRGRARHKGQLLRRCLGLGGSASRMLGVALDLHAFLDELAEAAVPHDQRDNSALCELAAVLARLDLQTTVAAEAEGASPGCVLFVVAPDAERGHVAAWLADQYQNVFADLPGLEAELIPRTAGLPEDWHGVSLNGLAAAFFADHETGTHLQLKKHGPVVPLRVGRLPIAEGESAVDVVQALLRSRERWLERLVAGTAVAEEDPLRWKPVVRLYDEQGSVLDFRTGLIGAWPLDTGQLRQFLLGGLRLPAEFREFPLASEPDVV